MIEITLNDKNLNVGIQDIKGYREKNINDLLKNIDMPIHLSLGAFKDFYDGVKKVHLLKDDEICKILLNSKILPNHRIPASYQKTDTNIDLSCDKNKIIDTATKILNAPLYTIYECKTETDIISACIYHFISKGYILKFCNNCKHWFIGKGKKGCCSSECEKEYNQKYESKKISNEKIRQKKPIPKKLKQIRDMLGRRNTNEKEIFEKDLLNFKNNNPTEDQLLNYLSQEHDRYRKL